MNGEPRCPRRSCSRAAEPVAAAVRGPVARRRRRHRGRLRPRASRPRSACTSTISSAISTRPTRRRSRRRSRPGTTVDRHPAEKDATDLELAFDAAIARGARRVVLVDGGGDRLDHLLGNLLLLASPAFAGVEVEAFCGTRADRGRAVAAIRR